MSDWKPIETARPRTIAELSAIRAAIYLQLCLGGCSTPTAYGKTALFMDLLGETTPQPSVPDRFVA